MKKSIRPPENWQDFETLCKKLFGEVWGCQYTIKKNGRQGQSQAGVDVYGKPKGQNDYWGIQCKGKDNYLNTQLTKKEIDEEIKNALGFEPKLKAFIFATTAHKDVEIEKYIRIKDKESIDAGNFEIVIYSWPDLVDLIEENKETFNWYINQIQFKDQFDVSMSFLSQQQDLIFRPKFLKTINKFELKSSSIPSIDISKFSHLYAMPVSHIGLFGSNKVNHGWCSVDVTIKNTGSRVIEDWKLWLEFGESVRKVDDDFTKDIFMYKEVSKFRTSWANDQNQILYKPLENGPLIQKDSRTFTSYCIPIIGANEVLLKWHLLARDFDREGEVKFAVVPDYEIKTKVTAVDSADEVRTEEEISEFIETVVSK